MNRPLETLTIGAFAAVAGVNIETVRFYQRRGLMQEPVKPLGSIRRYGSQDYSRLHFIRSAQRMGFSLDEVAELLTLEDGTHCAKASRLAGQKLIDVRTRLADLQRIEQALQALVDRCQVASGQQRCPLIDALKTEQGA